MTENTVVRKQRGWGTEPAGGERLVGVQWRMNEDSKVPLIHKDAMRTMCDDTKMS